MFFIVAVILLLPSQTLALYFGSGAAMNHHIHRRGIALLCYQMEQTLGHSCMDYMGYGCFCGPGGYGAPVDESDRCCQQHDRCYGEVKCKHSWYDYFVHYKVECTQSGCHCTDAEESSPCAYTSCECDRVFVECLKLNQPINPRYKKYDKIQCNATEMSLTEAGNSSQVYVVSSQTNVTYSQTNVTYSQTNVTYSQTNVTYSQTKNAHLMTNVTFSETNAAFSEKVATSSKTNDTSVKKNLTPAQINETFSQTNTSSTQTAVTPSQIPVTSSTKTNIASRQAPDISL